MSKKFTLLYVIIWYVKIINSYILGDGFRYHTVIIVEGVVIVANSEDYHVLFLGSGKSSAWVISYA